jgi:hypothetical protein
MHQSLLSRATAVILAVLFLGGVGGVSGLDALLYHRASTPVAAHAPHVEAAGQAGCHADHCLLAFRLPDGSAAPPLTVPLRLEGVAVRSAAAPRVVAPPHRDATVLPQPRAPPASPA